MFYAIEQRHISLPRKNDTPSLYIRNFKIVAGLCIPEQVSLYLAWSGTPEDTFSHGVVTLNMTCSLGKKEQFGLQCNLISCL